MSTSGRSGRSSAQQGKCRIIAGRWRGRIIKFGDAEGLRPTTDRIRETVFSWLQPYIVQSRCLDCFAGSGVLGFEALSRGAAEVVFIEQNKTTADNLVANARMLPADTATVVCRNAMEWLLSLPAESGAQKFDLVFLDPPFHTGILEKSCVLLDDSGCLSENAIIYVEHAIDEDVVLPEHWVCLKEKRAGQVLYRLFEKRE